MPLSIEKAQEIWGPHHSRIVGVIRSAWDEFKTTQRCRIEAGFSSLMYDRTKSNDIFDGIARYAIAEFGSDDKFTLKNQAQTFKLFHQGCCIRFKKGGADLLGRNWPTQEAMAFMEADGVLPGMPPHTAKLEIIWRANELFTDLDSVHIVSRDGEKLIWEYSIDLADDAGVVVALPTNPVEPDGDGDNLIKPKRDRDDADLSRD